MIVRYVERIEIYFLPKGHTHGEIDQMFSCLARFLAKNPAKSLPELMFSLQEAYNNRRKKKAKKQAQSGDLKQDKSVTCQIIDTVVDVVTWLQGMEIPGVRSKL